MSDAQTWPGHTGWGPALLIAGGTLLIGLLLIVFQSVSSIFEAWVVTYALVSFALLATGAVLVYQAQRAWVSQKGSEIATPKAPPPK